MINALLGKKLGMHRILDPNGAVVGATIVAAGPCYVTQLKTAERDGYEAVQIGFEESEKLNKPRIGHLGGLPKLRHLREVQAESGADLALGQKFDATLFEVGDVVDVIGTSKGKGFAGVMKRHGFHGGPKTHGQSDRWRAPGSIGAGTTPGRVLKGTRMPGRMGAERVTVKNLEIVAVDPVRNLVALQGSVPGPTGALLMLRKSQAKKKRLH
jgi:large subunit ribosomal protein L3